MPDLTISTKQLAALGPVLLAIGPLTPPPTAKGRYALGKLAGVVEPAFALYAKQQMDLVVKVATKDEAGNPIIKAIAGGQVSFDIRADAREEWATESAAIEAEVVTLTGCRAITHAELGECPLTIAQERVLIDCGLLDDVEPV